MCSENKYSVNTDVYSNKHERLFGIEFTIFANIILGIIVNINRYKQSKQSINHTEKISCLLSLTDVTLDATANKLFE